MKGKSEHRHADRENTPQHTYTKVKAEIAVIFASQRMPEDCQQSPRNQGKGLEQILTGLRRTQPGQHLDLWKPPELRDNTCLFCESFSLGYFVTTSVVQMNTLSFLHAMTPHRFYAKEQGTGWRYLSSTPLPPPPKTCAYQRPSESLRNQRRRVENNSSIPPSICLEIFTQALCLWDLQSFKCWMKLEVLSKYMKKRGWA